MNLPKRPIRTGKAGALAGMLLLLMMAVAGCSTPSHSTRMVLPEETTAGIPDLPEEPPEDGEETDPWTRKLADRYFLEGSLLQMQERYADAIVQYRRALRFMPASYSVVHFAIARCYLALGIPDTAIIYGREAVDRDPGNIDARTQLAELMLANGRLGGAIREYEEVVRLQPNDIQSRFSLARLLQWSDPGRSIQHYEYLRRNVDGSEDVLLSLSELYLNQENYDEAINVMRELVMMEPGDPDLHGFLAEVYVRAGRFDEAVQLLLDADRQILPASSYEEFAVAQLDAVAENLLINDDIDFRSFAGKLAVQMSAKLPGSWEVALNSGLIHYHLGNERAADSLILQALSSESSTTKAWMDAAILYVNDGQSSRALGFMLPTSPRHADDSRTPYLIGYAYLLMDQYDSAEHHLRHSVALDEQNSEAWGHLAMIYKHQGKTATSDNAYERALEHDPYNPTLLNNYAYSLAERDKRLEKALVMVEQALEAEPENESFLDTRGWIYYKMGMFDDALRDIQQAVNIGGASSEVLMHLGDVQQALGDTSAARDAYERALKLSPDNEDLRRKLESVR